MDSNTLISVQDLKVYFRSGVEVAPAVDGVSFHVGREETVCLVGESGCGESANKIHMTDKRPYLKSLSHQIYYK